jgi:hypothetical protein
MEIKLTPQAIIPEIEMVQPKVAELRLYNAKTWKYDELNQSSAIPITRTVTVTGVDGTISWCNNLFYVDDRLAQLDSWSMPLNR